MKYGRWIGLFLLIFVTGYISIVGLFADSSGGGLSVLVLIFLAGCAGVGALLSERWQLAVLCSWGGVLIVVLELGSTISRGPVAGQQSVGRLVLTAVIVIGLSLLGGYIGMQLRQRMGKG